LALSNVLPFPVQSVDRANVGLLAALKEVDRTRAAFVAFQLAQRLKHLARDAHALADLMREIGEAGNEDTASAMSVAETLYGTTRP
jgi:hypothetical protein